ncbi:MAG: RNA polymerase sigma factor [Flammeovirgaceae bacterium]|nr:MAG: RNA polymerase sigma factor [Flammeovirgaceae bacterium]
MDLTMHLKEEAFIKERSRLLSFIRHRVASLEDAEDILQDVFYQFLAGFETIQSVDSITAWLFSVARNKIIDRYRRNSNQPLKTDFTGNGGTDEEGPLLLLEILPDFGNSPDEVMMREVLWDTLTDALAELPTEQREVFIQNELEGKSFREMAEETGISVNTLLSRKRYAVRALRHRLQTIYNDL